MPVKINEPELDVKLIELEKARAWSPRVVSKLEALIRAEEDEKLFRVNPIAFGTERGVEEQEAIDLFLHASKAGLFQMHWGVVCPSCGDVVESFRSLKTFHNRCTCRMCHLETTVDLDDYIQVSFTISPSVRDLKYHHPEALSIEDYLGHYHFSPEGRMGKGGPRFIEVVPSMMYAASWLEPGTKDFALTLRPGLLMGWDMLTQAGFMFHVAEGAPASPGPVELALKDGKYAPENGALPPGPATVRVDNRSGSRASIMLVALPADYHTTKGNLVFDPFLTGRRLLTCQVFRDLYRTETFGGNEGIGVKDTTILFTDLKGSTQMYDSIGDLKAFALVRQHFDRLGRVIYGQAGAVVKTIGDAVMATFATPSGATRAALLMLDEIDKFNREHGAEELILKIGVHHGASIAVTLNERLDYFGQTVNIAARVQGLAGAEEIYLTQDVYESPGVKEIVAPYRVTPEHANLKGVAGSVKVYRITEPGKPFRPAEDATRPKAANPQRAKASRPRRPAKKSRPRAAARRKTLARRR